jgi:hypothetical protein
METLLVYALLTSAMFYLGSRAVITQWLWSRYPPKLARWADCAACSGFWYGLIVGVTAKLLQNGAGDLLQNGAGILGEPYSPIVIGLCSMVWTPIVAGYMQAGFERLGSAVTEEDTGLGPEIEDERTHG